MSGVHSQTSRGTSPRSAFVGSDEDLDRATAELLGDRRQHAGVARIDQAEDDGDDDGRDHHRNDEHGAHEADAAELAGAEQGERQTQHGLERHRGGDEA